MDETQAGCSCVNLLKRCPTCMCESIIHVWSWGAMNKGDATVGRTEIARQYPPDVLQGLRGRRRRDASAFGYDSDDSSLSSNTSSNKSSDRGSGSGPSRTERLSLSTDRLGYNGGLPLAHARYEWRGRRRRMGPERYFNFTYPCPVKYSPDDLLNGSEWDDLSQEIWERFIRSQQTEETFRKKMNLWRYLYVTIKSIFPRYGLYVVGSTMSGFGLENSDMDLCLYVRAPETTDTRGTAMAHLNCILSYLRSVDPTGLEAELIPAKVPLLKLVDVRHKLHVDLNCNNVVGIRNTNLLYSFSTMDWRVRPLVALTKLWAQAHNINDARQRTLSSYSLTLMVIHFLQCGVWPAVLPKVVLPAWEHRRTNKLTIAELFVAFLRYYAQFPFDKMAVSVRAGCRIPISECRTARSFKNDPHQWKLICIEEPFDLTNTARSVYDPETFARIVATFHKSHTRLAATRHLVDAWPAR